MFLCANGNFHSPVECMLIILSDKKIGSVSHPGAVEWPVSLFTSHTSLVPLSSCILSVTLSVRVSFWLSQIPLVRRALFGLTWDKNRPTRQLYVILHYCWTGEWDCDVQVMCGTVAKIMLRPVLLSNRTTTDCKQKDNIHFRYTELCTIFNWKYTYG